MTHLNPNWLENIIMFGAIYLMVMYSIFGYLVWRLTRKWIRK